ncbi:NAC domain-containing protein 17-like isoform X2 [Abrus precatorius]|uniref:NAC domain-containing protein 17-like isoform X2 n=2 Tax=Abrus precatorius TaxID=3816 RepID=A0A8B8MCB9_ABRPR|nr:NAC domain-containing protein 17-like isoform X2 [Abrus precatorius]
MGEASEPASADCFSKMMSSMPGFRFHPTDEELVMYYLKRKICGKKLNLNVIRETDVYKWDPEDLPGLSILRTGDRQWFFFCHRDRKYPNGGRSNRATKHGYWKATGKDRNVMCNSRDVGVKKTLVYYVGRAPNGKRTDWVMHEYTMDEEELKRCQGVKDYYALYKVYKKSGPGPKNGEQYGAPFNEEEWADEDIVDFNNKAADREAPNALTETVNDQMQRLFDDEIDIIKEILDDDLVLDPQHVGGYPDFPQVVTEETQSTVVDQISEAMIFPEPSRIFDSNSQYYDVQPSFDFNQSDTSHLHVSEASEVSSAPNIQIEGLDFQEDGFLEINDLVDTEPALSNVEKPVENLQYEDGLSELDLFQDAEMFLRDLGPILHETDSHVYLNTHYNNTENQNYQFLPNPEDANQTDGEFWMRGDGNTLSPSEGFVDSLSPSNPGVVCESVSFATEGNNNQSSTVEDIATSRFSSALWAFVESIPTTPASAAESDLVNRALNRMSSFSRVKTKHTNFAAGNDTATVKRAGRKGLSFLFFSIIIALCAFMWVSIGNLRLLGRCISP